MTACDVEGLGGTDPALNGTWVAWGAEGTFKNGNFETVYTDGSPIYKGTYTTNKGEMTSQITHVWGSSTFFPYHINTNFSVDRGDRWYTKDEIKAQIGPATIKPFVKEADYDRYYSSAMRIIDDAFPSSTIAYSIKGKTLTYTYADGTQQTYTKK